MFSKKLVFSLIVALVVLGSLLGTWLSKEDSANAVAEVAGQKSHRAAGEDDEKARGFLAQLVMKMRANMQGQAQKQEASQAGVNEQGDVVPEEEKLDPEQQRAEDERRWQEIEQKGLSRAERLKEKQKLLQERAERYTGQAQPESQE